MVREIDRMDVLRGRGGKGVWGVAEWLWETRYEERVANRLCGGVRVFFERAQRGTCTRTKKGMWRQREKEGGRALDIRLGGRDGIHCASLRSIVGAGPSMALNTVSPRSSTEEREWASAAVGVDGRREGGGRADGCWASGAGLMVLTGWVGMRLLDRWDREPH